MLLCVSHKVLVDKKAGFVEPNRHFFVFLVRSTPVGIRTSNLLIRSQMLYPIELRAHVPFQEPQAVLR